MLGTTASSEGFATLCCWVGLCTDTSTRLELLPTRKNSAVTVLVCHVYVIDAERSKSFCRRYAQRAYMSVTLSIGTSICACRYRPT